MWEVHVCLECMFGDVGSWLHAMVAATSNLHAKFHV
jgi:hypothetical protein